MAHWRNMAIAAGGAGGGGGSGYASEVLADSPLGYWRMDTAGAVFTNLGSLGATFNGSVVGSVTQADTGLLGAGADATNLSLSCTGGIFEVATVDSGEWPIAREAITVEFWLKTTNVLSPATVVDVSHDVNTNSDGQSMRVALNAAGLGTALRSDSVRQSSALTWNDGVTRHVVITSAAGATDQTPDIYVDGVLANAAFAPGASGFIEPTGYRVVVGERVTGGQLANPITIQELAVYDFELSTPRITAHYDTGILP